jgi:hypothetical protein
MEFDEFYRSFLKKGEKMKKTCFFTPLSAILNIKGRNADFKAAF